jgi:hypothetical protein
MWGSLQVGSWHGRKILPPQVPLMAASVCARSYPAAEHRQAPHPDGSALPLAWRLEWCHPGLEVCHHVLNRLSAPTAVESTGPYTVLNNVNSTQDPGNGAGCSCQSQVSKHKAWLAGRPEKWRAATAYKSHTACQTSAKAAPHLNDITTCV